MPRKKDVILVEEEKCKGIQKRLVLSDLRVVYLEFKDKIPDCKIGVSKFAELKPKHFVLAGTNDTHSVCSYMCVYNTSECEVDMIGPGDTDT